MKKILFLFALLPSMAFCQAVRIDVPLLTSGPNVPATSQGLPQALWITNATVQICQHPATLNSCTYVTTYTDSTEGTPCPGTQQITQLPGPSGCSNNAGPVGNVGFWYAGGTVDYIVTSAYGTYGPYTITGVNGSGAFISSTQPSAQTMAGPLCNKKSLSYDVVACYNADPTGVADSTTAIQNALNDATPVGGIVYIPPGKYLIGGPIQSACDAQICIPAFSINGPTGTVRIKGATKIRQDADWQVTGPSTVGTVLVTTGSGDALSAVFGAPTSSGGAANLNNGDVYFEDLDIRATPNPTIGLINMGDEAGASIVNFRGEVGQSYNGVTKTKPSNLHYGIILPQINNDTLSRIDNVQITGFNTGIVASEHADIRLATIGFGIVGYIFTGGYHNAQLRKVVTEEVGTPIRFGTVGPWNGVTAAVTMDGLDLEIDSNYLNCTVGDPWCYSGTDIDDPSNLGRGVISFVKVIGGTGITIAPLVINGSSGAFNNYSLYDITNGTQSFGQSVQARRTHLAVGPWASANSDNLWTSTDLAEYWDMDTVCGVYDSGSGSNPTARGAVGGCQQYKGGSGNTLGTAYADFWLQPSGGNTQIGNVSGTVTLKGNSTVSGNLTVTGTCTGCGGGGGSGVSSINTVTGAFTFTGPGVTCTSTTCTFSGGGGPGTVTSFAAPSVSWPTWLVPTVTNSTTTPSLAVAASPIPNAALANSATTVNGTPCTLGSSCNPYPLSTSGSLPGTCTTGQLWTNPSPTNTGNVIYECYATNSWTPLQPSMPGTPSVAASNGAGSGFGGTAAFVAGATDGSGWVTVNTGSSTTASAGVFTVSYSITYPVTPKCSVFPADTNSAALSGNGQVWVSQGSSTGALFVMRVGSTALATGTTYTFGYRCALL